MIGHWQAVVAKRQRQERRLRRTLVVLRAELAQAEQKLQTLLAEADALRRRAAHAWRELIARRTCTLDDWRLVDGYRLRLRQRIDDNEAAQTDAREALARCRARQRRSARACCRLNQRIEQLHAQRKQIKRAAAARSASRRDEARAETWQLSARADRRV